MAVGNRDNVPDLTARAQVSADGRTGPRAPIFLHPFELGDAAGCQTLCDEDVAILGETGVVRMHEFAILPLVRQRPQVLHFVESLDGPAKVLSF